MSENSEKYTLENSGDHHYAKATLDPETGKIAVGAITNFSSNASAGIQLVNGKMEGSFLHSGDNHTLQINAKSDGTYNGTYRDAGGNLEINFDGAAATLVSGEIPAAGVALSGDNHKATLSIGANGKLQGCIESTSIGNGKFRVEIQNGKPSGSFIHEGGGHQTEIKITPTGLKASISAGGFSFGVEKGKASVSAFGGLKLKF